MNEDLSLEERRAIAEFTVMSPTPVSVPHEAVGRHASHPDEPGWVLSAASL